MNRLNRALAWISLALAACSGQVNEGDVPDAGGNATGAPKDGGAVSPTAFGASQVQAAVANCNLPHGPVVTWSNDDAGTELESQIEGAWVLCPGTALGSDDLLAPGMVLTADGKWARLVPDGSGGLAIGQGVQNQGQWSVVMCGCSDPSFVTIEAATNEYIQFRASFESSPRRMYAALGSSDGVFLVPL
jgi:hypothetical protein